MDYDRMTEEMDEFTAGDVDRYGDVVTLAHWQWLRDRYGRFQRDIEPDSASAHHFEEFGHPISQGCCSVRAVTVSAG